MPQVISVSYHAIKSRVYRLIDALVVGEKTEADVQESIHRWWDLIPSCGPAHRSKISSDRAGTLCVCLGRHRRRSHVFQRLRSHIRTVAFRTNEGDGTNRQGSRSSLGGLTGCGKTPVLTLFEGRGFSRAVSAAKSTAALQVAERLENVWITVEERPFRAA
jgi:hypothetical protein